MKLTLRTIQQLGDKDAQDVRLQAALLVKNYIRMQTVYLFCKINGVGFTRCEEKLNQLKVEIRQELRKNELPLTFFSKKKNIIATATTILAIAFIILWTAGRYKGFHFSY